MLVQDNLLNHLDGSVAGLYRALQCAITLEHATIPAYLYALYSIKPGYNIEIADLIKSVVTEEMLHLAICCNILNGLGGQPDLRSPSFFPKYPGTLPGGVDQELVVPLAPFSKQLVHDVFMTIERPEERTIDPDQIIRNVGAQFTIGHFYQGIIAHIKKHEGYLFNDSDIRNRALRRHLSTGFEGLQQPPITDATAAIAAITLIMHQGEGTGRSPLDPEHIPAHYYRFAEIYYGRKLISNPDSADGMPEFVFKGHRIDFDPCGIWPVIVNPNQHTYSPQSQLFDLNCRFNYTYTLMLQRLHLVFNEQQDQLATAVRMMRELKEQAQVMMSMEIVPGLNAGPTFEYTPEMEV